MRPSERQDDIGFERELTKHAGFHVSMSAQDEQALVERLKAGENAAFEELVQLYQGRIYRLVFRMLGRADEAEDVAQDVFITVYQRIETFRGESKLSTWLYRVATNHAKNRIKYLSRRAHGRKNELDETRQTSDTIGATSNVAHVPRPDEVVEGRQLEVLVKRALDTLSDEHRELIVLRDIEGLSYEELQAITGLEQGTVKSRLHRARVALTTKVKELRGES